MLLSKWHTFIWVLSVGNNASVFVTNFENVVFWKISNILHLHFAIGVFDNCSHSLSEKGWSVGIRTLEPGNIKDARFYFTLRTDRARKSTTVYSHRRYRANAWAHLMATYSGRHMNLYVDGAKVCAFYVYWTLVLDAVVKGNWTV